MYYGGRDVTEEDLEKALLIGMSPHERRKHERKKGVSVKQENSNNGSNHIRYIRVKGQCIMI